MSTSSFANAVAGGVSVDAAFNTNGDTDNTNAFPADCYAGLEIRNSGTEYEYIFNGGASLIGTWLLAGNASQVWVERIISSGSFNDLDPGAGRHNCGTTRQFRLLEAGVGSTSCVVNFRFWNAASGGTMLDETGNITFTATVEL